MRNGVLLAVTIAVAVGLSTFATPAAAVSDVVEVEAALDDDAERTTLEFTFVADRSGTVTIGDDDALQTDGGNVDFEFAGWSGGGQSGSSGTWSVEDGTRYTVEYDATASSGATEQSHRTEVSVDYGDGTLAASEPLELDVDVLEPELGGVDSVSGDLAFEGDTAETTVTADVPNVGDGVLVVDDVTFSGVPSGISVSGSSVPDRISAGTTESVGIDVVADETVTDGTYSFDATVTDSQGNDETFQIEVEVTRPPVADVGGETVDLGDILVGESSTAEVPIQEVGGYQGLDGVTVEVAEGDPNGGLDVTVPWGFGTEPGGADNVSATISANTNARQHQELTFDVLLSGTDEDSPEREVTMVGRVIYPEELGRITASTDTFAFDQPRDAVSTQRMDSQIEIPNDGDLAMDVTSVSATASHPDVSASVSDVPDTVNGTSTGTATLTLAADPGTPEGSYEVEIDVQTFDAGSETITREFHVEHPTELELGETDVGFGEVTITDRVSRSIDVGERLGYNDLENVDVSITDGPDRWLNVSSRPPTNVGAGESAPLVLGLQFGTDAEAYQEYTWEITVDPDNVEAETITVDATAQLLSVEGINSDLEAHASGGGWQQQAATDTTAALSSMEQRLRDGDDVTAGDIWRSLTVGQSVVILMDSVETVESQQADGNYEDAQSRVVSALVAHNLVEEYVDEIDDGDAARQLQSAADATEESVAGIVTEQKGHYEEQLEGDATALERYDALDSLATLESHQGNANQADEFAGQAEQAFAEYQSLVGDGTERRQRARESRDALSDEATVTFFGQPVVTNPARIDSVRSLRQSATDDYDASVQAFRDAGATAEADATADEAAAASRELRIATYGLYAVTAIYVVVFAVMILKEALNARAYVRESREAASGNFLL